MIDTNLCHNVTLLLSSGTIPCKACFSPASFHFTTGSHPGSLLSHEVGHGSIRGGPSKRSLWTVSLLAFAVPVSSSLSSLLSPSLYCLSPNCHWDDQKIAPCITPNQNNAVLHMPWVSNQSTWSAPTYLVCLPLDRGNRKLYLLSQIHKRFQASSLSCLLPSFPEMLSTCWSPSQPTTLAVLVTRCLLRKHLHRVLRMVSGLLHPHFQCN